LALLCFALPDSRYETKPLLRLPHRNQADPLVARQTSTFPRQCSRSSSPTQTAYSPTSLEADCRRNSTCCRLREQFSGRSGYSAVEMTEAESKKKIEGVLRCPRGPRHAKPYPRSRVGGLVRQLKKILGGTDFVRILTYFSIIYPKPVKTG